MQNNNQNKKVFVGMSGGVDSALSALLLKRAGYDVTGVFIKTWQPDYIECTWKNDRLDAMRICAKLDIPFKTLDLEKEYKEHVIDYMLSEYKNNKIPNPDIMCNKYIKFDGFLNFARASGACIATGHYAKISQDESGLYLINAKDKSKDQTYFLYQIKQENLSSIIFPLSDLEKSEVKNIAKENSLHVTNKKESMGICMLGDISMKDFLIKELNPKSGNVCNESGEIIGTHDGVMLYTIGERHGFEVVKKNNANSNFNNFLENKKNISYDSLPYFVYEKDVKNNILYVTQNENKIVEKSKINFQNGFALQEVNSFVNFDNMSEIQKTEFESRIYKAQTRYHGELYDVKLEIINIEDNKNNTQIKITPVNNFSAIPGQSVVLYEGDKVLFGGVV